MKRNGKNLWTFVIAFPALNAGRGMLQPNRPMNVTQWDSRASQDMAKVGLGLWFLWPIRNQKPSLTPRKMRTAASSTIYDRPKPRIRPLRAGCCAVERPSSDDLADDLTFDERQPLVAAEVGVGEPVLVEP